MLNPKLLLEGFFDEYGYISELLTTNKFLILGSKGSGKSAIASRLELLAKEQTNIFVTNYDLKNFPFDTFSGLIPGSEAPQIKYPIHWEFLICICLIESFSHDRNIACNGKVKLKNMVHALEELGFFPSKTLTEKVKTTTKKEFRASLPSILDAHISTEKEERQDIKFLQASLREVCFSVSGENMHYIIIDGLDDVLTRRQKQYESLSALILAADHINKLLKGHHANAKIIVLCRTDLLDKLPGPNKNKIRQDSSILLDWYQDVRNIHATNLIKLVNLRASISYGRQIDMFSEFLPSTIRRGDDTDKTLLENTRHTPRDMIQLMNYIKKICTGNKPTDREILTALRTFSYEYFLPEIIDELDGFLTREEIEGTFSLLSTLKKRRLTYHELTTKVKSDTRFQKLDLDNILNQLFECSAIGNIRSEQSRDDRIFFKYRSRNAIFNRDEDVLIHIGLCKALNIF